MTNSEIHDIAYAQGMSVEEAVAFRRGYRHKEKEQQTERTNQMNRTKIEEVWNNHSYDVDTSFGKYRLMKEDDFQKAVTELLAEDGGEVKVMTAKEVLLKYFPTNEYMHPPIPVGEIPKLIEAMEFYASQHTKGA